jgi:ribosomal protein L21
MWDGSLTLECPTTGYKMNISFAEKNETTNKIEGEIFLNGQPIIGLSGAAGKVVHYWKTGDKKKKKEELYNFSTAPKKNENVSYPPVESRVEMNSLRLWKEVSDAVIRDDMFAADNAKRKVEHDQRIREKKRELEGADYKAVYFDQVTVNQKAQWVPKEGIEISKASLEALKDVVTQQRLLAEERALNPVAEPEVVNVTPETQKLKTEKSSKITLMKSKEKLNKDQKQSLSPDQEVEVGSPKDGKETDPENCIIS